MPATSSLARTPPMSPSASGDFFGMRACFRASHCLFPCFFPLMLLFVAVSSPLLVVAPSSPMAAPLFVAAIANVVLPPMMTSGDALLIGLHVKCGQIWSFGSPSFCADVSSLTIFLASCLMILGLRRDKVVQELEAINVLGASAIKFVIEAKSRTLEEMFCRCSKQFATREHKIGCTFSLSFVKNLKEKVGYLTTVKAPFLFNAAHSFREAGHV